MGALTDAPLAGFARASAAVAENLRFFTRIPLGRADRAPDFAHVGWAAPVAGACVGALGGATLVAGRMLGLPTLMSATLAVMAQSALTGALHEDGLADAADGFGGGRDREAKLAIMRDSRIGTYGAVALGLVLLLRVEALAVLARPFSVHALAALTLSGAAARAAALAPLAWLAPARTEGIGARASALGGATLRGPLITLALLAFGLGLASLEAVRALFACVVAAVATWLFVGLARRQIGGQTGDVCGAAAAIAEATVLTALLIGGREA